VLIRSWNLFHGNTVPTRREAYLEEMIELVTADDPDVVCVQEVPAWALDHFTVGDVAAQPVLGPLPIPRRLGRALTSLNHGLLRSAFAGQGNAMQIASRLRVADHKVLTLNSRRFRDAKARELELDPVARLAWAKERRIVQAVRLATGGGRTSVVANLHCTSYPDSRLADAELLRAAWFTSTLARPDEVVVLAGDFNVTLAQSQALRDLVSPEWGFVNAGEGIDHILVRGAEVTGSRAWAKSERTRGDRVLSDHAPIEAEIRDDRPAGADRPRSASRG
jgi:endonuclease/exonuclease/phosphatase family metal-dependent hydrolase